MRPGEKPPVLPAVASENSSRGANAFALFWFSAWDWAYATGDPTLIEMSSSNSCTDCTLVVSIFDDAMRKSQHFVGGRLKIRRSQITDSMGRYGSTMAVDVTLSQEGLAIVGPSAAVVSRATPTRSITFRLWMKRLSERWTVAQKGRVTS